MRNTRDRMHATAMRMATYASMPFAIAAMREKIASCTIMARACSRFERKCMTGARVATTMRGDFIAICGLPSTIEALPFRGVHNV